MFSSIRSKDDVESLQTDLVSLEYRSSVSRLSFNQSKCRHQQITRKIAPTTSSCKLGNYLISTTKTKKILACGYHQTDLEKTSVFSANANKRKTAKANKLLGHIRRNATLVRNTAARRSMYLALVRSHFGYASQVWAPQSIELTHKLERTQRHAT